MKPQFTRAFTGEIQEVQQLFQQSLLPWWEEIQDYIKLVEKEATWHNLPASVLAVYHYLGVERSFSVAMANIFKIIFLASSIHELVKDDEEGQKYNQDMQFSILIADYIYGRVLKLLVEAKGDKLLDILAQTIGEINEGMIMRHKMNISYYITMKKTRASLYSAVFLTAAKLAEERAERQELFEKLGFNLGMALELISESGYNPLVTAYITNSAALFTEVNHIYGVVNSPLESLVREMVILMETRERKAAAI